MKQLLLFHNTENNSEFLLESTSAGFLFKKLKFQGNSVLTAILIYCTYNSVGLCCSSRHNVHLTKNIECILCEFGRCFTKDMHQWGADVQQPKLQFSSELDHVGC